MNWFVLRQHRRQFLIFALLLAAFAAVLIPTGIHFWDVYQNALTTCAQNSATPNCSDLPDSLFQGDGAIADAVVLGAFAGPILVGMFLGAPLLAREYEEGTNKLAWTQSVSRRKWLTVKLLWALTFALLYGIALTVLTTWWSRTTNALYLNRFVQGHFETQGLMPAAYALFFTAIGFMAGAWFRKTLVALGITIGVFALCMGCFAQLIRPHDYMTPVTVTAPIGPGIISSKIPAGAWVISHDIMDNRGKIFDGFSSANMPAQCAMLTQDITAPNGSHVAKVKASGGDPVVDCLNQAGWHEVVKYQPSYRYWDFQRIEAGIYLSITAVAVGATYWLVLRRDA